MEDVLVIDKLRREYPDFTLQDISLRVPRGAIVGFIGENGAGKTTTIKLVLGGIRRDAGKVFLFGQESCGVEKENREKLGVVLGELNLPETLTGVQVNRIMAGIYPNWEEAVFYGYLEKFGLKRQMKIKAYSRGMKMKLSIAIALSHHAEFLILDEPTSGLDPVVRDEILDLFLEFIQDERHSIFVSSHIVGDLEKIADYIVFIHRGRIVLSEEKDVLLEKYRVMKGPEEAFLMLPSGAAIGCRKGRFDTEALVCVEDISGLRLPEGTVLDRAGLEDIMLYYVKGDQS